MIDFFKIQFKRGNSNDNNNCSKAQNSLIKDDMHVQLSNPYTREEVYQTMEILNSGVVIGPDGIPALFYQS